MVYYQDSTFGVRGLQDRKRIELYIFILKGRRWNRRDLHLPHGFKWL